jgi:hypothetical protein
MKKILMTVSVALALSTTGVMAKTAATVNGNIITVEDANKALDILTKGKKKWETLPAEGKEQLIQMMAPSKLVAEAANKTLSKKERESALSGFWMQKKMSEIKISDEQAKKAYENMKKAAAKAKNKQAVPAFEKAKANIKMQMAQQKVVGELMKKAKIKVK